MLKKTVSDSLAKNQCKKYLENLGFENLHPARGNSCDLIGYKNNQQYFFEICTLTTPICHYRLIVESNGNLKRANIGKKSVMATEKMILDIWKKFREWKPK